MYAKVDYVMGGGDVIAASVTAWAALPTETGPGLDQGDATQLATDLSVIRHTATLEEIGCWAIFDAAGAFRGKRYERLRMPDVPEGWQALPIVGDERLPSTTPLAGEGLPKDWGRQLALAIDRTIEQIAKAKTAAGAPAGFGSLTVPIASPALVAIIVGGAALAVIGTVAAWRYLDPGLRTRIAEVRAAAKSYQDRLRVKNETGTMPPPSPIETSNADAVATAAGEREKSDWLWGAAAVGGITGGSLLTAVISRELRK